MDSPIYVISVSPLTKSTLKRIFESSPDSLMHLLEHPGSFRYAGWDLNTLDRAKIVSGDYLEVVNGDRKRIQLYEDGTLILKVLADHRFLSWGRNYEEFIEKPRLNTLALIEVTTNFVHFYKKVIEFFEKVPEKVRFDLLLKNIIIDGKAMYIVPYKPNSLEWLFDNPRYESQENEINISLEIFTDDISNKPSRVSYVLVEKVLLKFGIPVDKIPYTKEDNGEKVISVDDIKKSG